MSKIKEQSNLEEKNRAFQKLAKALKSIEIFRPLRKKKKKKRCDDTRNRNKKREKVRRLMAKKSNQINRKRVNNWKF